MEGTIRALKTEKQYGFIISNDKDYFFHRRDFEGHWEDLIADFENHNSPIQVTFNELDTPRGLRAICVRRVDWPNG